jgi:hypothetical protein
MAVTDRACASFSIDYSSSGSSSVGIGVALDRHSRRRCTVSMY